MLCAHIQWSSDKDPGLHSQFKCQSVSKLKSQRRIWNRYLSITVRPVTKADFFSSQAVKWRPLPVSDEFVEGEKKNKKTHIAL